MSAQKGSAAPDCNLGAAQGIEQVDSVYCAGSAARLQAERDERDRAAYFATTAHLRAALVRKRRCEGITARARKYGLTVEFAQEEGGGARIMCGSTRLDLNLADLDRIEWIVDAALAGAEPSAGAQKGVH